MTITDGLWTFHDRKDGDFDVHHARMGHLDMVAITAIMPFWAPAIIRAAVAEIEKLRAAAEAPTPLGIQPMETAPRGGNRVVDIWVKRHPTDLSAYRVPGVSWSDRLSDPAKPSSSERFSGWYGSQVGCSYLDRDQQVVGWAPIPQFD